MQISLYSSGGLKYLFEINKEHIFVLNHNPHTLYYRKYRITFSYCIKQIKLQSCECSRRKTYDESREAKTEGLEFPTKLSVPQILHVRNGGNYNTYLPWLPQEENMR